MTAAVMVAVTSGVILACSPGANGGARSDTTAAGARGETAAAAPAPVTGAAAAAGPALPPPPPARDADQDFLRHMLDHHEGLLAEAHEAMMRPAGHAAHGTSQDPADVDAVLDAEKTRMLALLDSVYGERYSPRAAPAADSAGAAAAGEAAHAAEAAATAARYRAGVTLVDRFLPQLRRAPVRALAAQVRATQLERSRTPAPSPAR